MFQLSIPDRMREFGPVVQNGTSLFWVGRIFFGGGQTIVISNSAYIMYFDHRYVLALKLARNNRYLLLEEIDSDINDLVRQWSDLYMESLHAPSTYARAHAAEALEPLLKELRGTLQKKRYILPKVLVINEGPIAAIDEESPGKKVQLW